MGSRVAVVALVVMAALAVAAAAGAPAAAGVQAAQAPQVSQETQVSGAGQASEQAAAPAGGGQTPAAASRSQDSRDRRPAERRNASVADTNASPSVDYLTARSSGLWTWDPVAGQWYWTIIIPAPTDRGYYHPRPIICPWPWYVPQHYGEYTYVPNPDYEKGLFGMFEPPKPPKMAFAPGEGPAFPYARRRSSPEPTTTIIIRPPQPKQPR